MTGSTSKGTVTNLFSDYNCLMKVSCWWLSGGAYSLADWQSKSRQDLNSLVADPLFVNWTMNDFSLATNSPCIRKGPDLGADFQLGFSPGSVAPNPAVIQRPQGSKWTLGRTGPLAFPGRRA